MTQNKLFRQSQDHVAIMKPSWGLIKKIITGEKRLETRWYENKIAPWDNIFEGDRIYFKDAGGKVRLRAEVGRVWQYVDLNPDKVLKLLIKYARTDGIGSDEKEIKKFERIFEKKKYMIAIEILNPIKIKPFGISKKGFGILSGWITVPDINMLIKKR